MSETAPPILVPRITTDRLLLREPRMADFDAYATNATDPVATKFLQGVLDRRAAWRMFSSAAGCWVLMGTGWWSVERRDTGDVVGTVGAFYREWTPDLEIGWSFYRPFWKQGYAKEASAAALAWGFREKNARRAIAHIDRANLASVRVGEGIGMHFEADADFYGQPIGRWAIELRD